MRSTSFDAVYGRSIDDPEGFWGEAARALDWDVPPQRVLDRDASPLARWFPDGRAQHVPQRARPPRRRRPRRPGRADLRQPRHGHAAHLQLRRVARRGRAAGRRAAGPRRRARRPRHPLPADGAPGADGHAGLRAPGRDPLGRVRRLRRARARRAHRRCPAARRAVRVLRPRGGAHGRLQAAARRGAGRGRARARALRDPAAPAARRPRCRRAAISTGRRSSPAARPAGCVPVQATDPLYILYTSGTTGRPKGVVRDNGGHAVALAWSMPNVYDVHPGEVFWAASDVGWVVGHSYIVYAPLLVGATTVLYEGKPVGTPDAGAFWRVIEEHGVAALFTAPTAIRAIRKEDPEAALLGGRALPSLRTLFLAGERTDPDTYEWAQPRARPPRDRPLVADRDGLGDGGELPRPRAAAGQVRLAQPPRARVPHRRPGLRRRSRPSRRAGRDRRAPAAPPGHAARRSGTTTSAAWPRTSRATRGGTSRGTEGTSTTTATCS